MILGRWFWAPRGGGGCLFGRYLQYKAQENGFQKGEGHLLGRLYQASPEGGLIWTKQLLLIMAYPLVH
jgi:hypothetical protein